jgi:hypothetical protein
MWHKIDMSDARNNTNHGATNMKMTTTELAEEMSALDDGYHVIAHRYPIHIGTVPVIRGNQVPQRVYTVYGREFTSVTQAAKYAR